MRSDEVEGGKIADALVQLGGARRSVNRKVRLVILRRCSASIVLVP